MITAFQRSAFQDNAFQIGVTVGGGGGRVPIQYAREWLRREQERVKREEEEERKRLQPAAPVLEVVEARAEPIVTDLSALVAVEAAAPAPMTKDRGADEELDQFMAFLLKIAREDETA